MAQVQFIHRDDVAAAHFADRYSLDLVGGKHIPTTSGFNLGVAYYLLESFGDPQVHSDQEAVYVVAGVGELLVGDEVVPLRPGTAVYVPPGAPHCGRRTSAEPVEVVYTHGAI